MEHPPPPERPDPSSCETDGAGSGPPARRRLGPRATLLVVAAFVAGSILSGVGTAWASHQFWDVPGSNPFHDDIDWMADHDIANGFTDGGYHPESPVSRQTMAAFMRRYNASITLEENHFDPSPGTIWSGTAKCPTGSRAIGGGGEMPGGNYMMTVSRPNGSQYWNVYFESEGGATRDPYFFRIYALCAPTV